MNMKMLTRVCLLGLGLMTAACTQQAAGRLSPSAAAGESLGLATPMAATIQFGQPNVGSPFAAPLGHDHSSNAKDNLVPRTVVIQRGGTVTFKTFGVHQLAIYAPGTKPDDIDATIVAPLPAGCPPIPMINDTNNRVALITKPCGPAGDLTHTFNTAGRYLAICTFAPHFTDFSMYGWVEVK